MYLRNRRIFKLFVSVLLFFWIYTLCTNWKASTDKSSNPPKCGWPPANLDDIRTPQGSYNITLCIYSFNSAQNKTKMYRFESLFRQPNLEKMVTFEDLGGLRRNIWKKYARYPDVYQTYPQDVPFETILKAVKSGQPVTVTPDYNFPINILHTSRSVCSDGSKHDLIIVVKSGIYGWDNREVFRAYIRHEMDVNPSLKIGVVFSIGLPRSQGGRTFNRSGTVMYISGQAGDLLEQYSGKGEMIRQKIQEEIIKYDDIILADYEDTYYNLTWKTVTNLRWISAFCNKLDNDLFMIIDDDHMVNVPLLLSYLNGIPREQRRTSIHGRIASFDGAYRSPRSKLYLSYSEIPWDRMCAYPRGFAQLIGADIVDNMAIASAYTRYNYMHEDVYLGLLAFKLQIPLIHVDAMFDHFEYNHRRRPGQLPLVALREFMHEYLF
ncbi:hypothetical protein Aperf_G00000057478 [Anoplocephala perfoliata]